MRCKKHHVTSLSSNVGVCASCLSERLFCLIAAQATQSQALDDRFKFSTTTNPPPPPTITTSPSSKSVKTGSDLTLSDFTDHRDSCMASTSSPSLLSNFLAGHRKLKKQSILFSLDESTIICGRKICRNKDRRMSPARYSDDGEEEFGSGSSGYSLESSQGWKETPVRHCQIAGAAAEDGQAMLRMCQYVGPLEVT
ncbi:hypothetical protein RJ639_002273 [Escallonia herrerae]|uniref:Uncharacterized protein n=1 Tax=Escallonia herrerae TaxID=1293975 RepID=A0AA88XGI5_9ASTE|nr:hypothetical protein RJ639_002273 [Escallonia herrerae]